MQVKVRRSGPAAAGLAGILLNEPPGWSIGKVSWRRKHCWVCWRAGLVEGSEITRTAAGAYTLREHRAEAKVFAGALADSAGIENTRSAG
jgi:hypothetical protein